MTESWGEIEAPLRERVGRVAAWVRERIAEDRRAAHYACATVVRDRSGITHSVGGDWRPDDDGDVRLFIPSLGAREVDAPVGFPSNKARAHHQARHDPTRVKRQCDALEDAMTELEKLAEHPDARAGARAAIMSLAGIWAGGDEISAIYLGDDGSAWTVVSDSWISRDPQAGETASGVRYYLGEQPNQHTNSQEQQ